MVLPPSTRQEEVAMLEAYFVKPTTIDRIRGSWIAAEIDQGRKSLCFTRGVPLSSIRCGLDNQYQNRAEQALSRIQGQRVTHTINLAKARG
jgi:hypothetical protein